MSPDPRFYYSSTGHSKAMSYLQYGLTQGEGFIVITGDIGTGKTIIVKNLLNELDPDTFIARQLVTTYLDESDLIEMVCDSFDLPTEGLSKAGLLNQLKKFLTNSYNNNKRVLFIVDEVQNLPLKTVEELRMLSNFQINDVPLIQSFLVGQKEFIEILQNDRMEQLRQRVTASTHLGPLKQDETEEYINYRLLVAGWSGVGLLFDHEACLLIHELTEGVPRRINVFCDRILLYGFLEEIKRFTVKDINNVADELANEVTSPIKKKKFDNIDRETHTNQVVTKPKTKLKPKTKPKTKPKPKPKPKTNPPLLTEAIPANESVVENTSKTDTDHVITNEAVVEKESVIASTPSITDTMSNTNIDTDDLMQDLEVMSNKLNKQFDDIINKFNKK